jgi:hypothetical protein
VALTGYHRKHAIRLLREQPGATRGHASATGYTTRRYARRRRCCGKRPTGFAASA